VKVRWTRLATADLNSAYDHVAAENPSAAARLRDRIENGVAILARHPSAGRIGRIQGTRELVVTGTPFIVPYRIRKGQVELLALIHGSRRWPDSLQM
jgi:toxin ParE1/3/4